MSERNVLVPLDQVQSAIVTLRGIRVILDRDLAAFYGVTTGNLNKAVNRNLDRFPADFMLSLTLEEQKNLMFQSGISSGGGNPKAVALCLRSAIGTRKSRLPFKLG